MIKRVSFLSLVPQRQGTNSNTTHKIFMNIIPQVSNNRESWNNYNYYAKTTATTTKLPLLCPSHGNWASNLIRSMVRMHPCQMPLCKPGLLLPCSLP